MRLAPAARDYGVALLASVTVTLLALLLRPYLIYGRLALFLAAVTLSAQVGGLGPGLLATLLGALAIDLIFLEPSGPKFADPYPTIAMVEFIAIGVLVSVLSAGLRTARHRAESSLALLDTLQSRSPVGFGFADTRVHLVRENEVLAALLDARAVEGNDVPIEERPMLWSTVEPLVRRVLTSGENITNLDLTGVRPADPETVCSWLTSLYPVRVGGGPIEGVGVVATDLTEIRRLEAEQRRLFSRAQTAEAYYRSLFEHLDDAVFVLNASGESIDANHAASGLLGYSRGELLRMSVADVAARGGEWADREFEVLLRDSTWHGETELRRKNGAIVPVDVRVSAVPLPSGTVYVAVAHDLTERLEAEETRVRLAREATARAASEHERERLQAILEQSPSGIVYLDARTGSLLANQRMTELLGEPVSGESGVTLFQTQIQRLDGSSIPEHDLPAVRALRGETISDEEFVIVRADRRAIPVLGSAAPVYGSEGKIEGAVVSYQDITSLKDLERLREDFMATAAHELRSPITVIKGQSQLALIRDATEELARRSFETIVRQSNRMAQIIDDVLLAARLRPKAATLNVTPFDLRPLVEEAVATMRRIYPKIRFDITIDVSVEVDADPTLIGTAIARLLANAVRYSPPDSSIEVTLQRKDDQAYVAVTDHGIGIAAERQAHIFEPFFEPVPAGAPGYLTVVSLDLYLAKSIVEANGGQIGFTSTARQGSTFFFTLPLAG